MGEVLTEMDDNLYKVSYIMTNSKRYQCPVCGEEFSFEEAVQVHMQEHRGSDDATVFIKTEHEEYEDDGEIEEVAEAEEIDEDTLEEKIQNHVRHALSSIEKLTQQMVHEDDMDDVPSEVGSHLEIEIKDDGEDYEVTSSTQLKPKRKPPTERLPLPDDIKLKRLKPLQYQCELCNKKYPKRHLMKMHMKEHEGDLNYSCDLCNKTFTFKQQLNTHRKCHTLERKFKCLTCDKSYKFKQQLNLHILTHSGIKPFSCETCQKCFTLERQLQSHLKVHSPVKPYICAQCGKCFKIKQQLQNHELTHYDIKPFICEVCTKSFKLKQQLQNHQKVHEDIKPYPCTVCGKAFKFKQQLQNHGKIHEGIKQFSCEFCEKEFMFKQQLQIHMKIHFGIKEFPCNVCTKDFRTKQQLQKHLEMHERKMLKTGDKSDDAMSEVSFSTTESECGDGGTIITDQTSLSEILANKSVVEIQVAPKIIIKKKKLLLRKENGEIIPRRMQALSRLEIAKEAPEIVGTVEVCSEGNPLEEGDGINVVGEMRSEEEDDEIKDDLDDEDSRNS